MAILLVDKLSDNPAIQRQLNGQPSTLPTTNRATATVKLLVPTIVRSVRPQKVWHVATD